MFKHDKALLREVKVERPNPQYAVLMQVKDPELKDLFLDIAAEELSHMEMVAQTINLLNGHDVNYEGVEAGEIETHVLSGLAPFLINLSGAPWTADYVTVTGDLVADLLSNIASEQRAKVVYEYLYRQIEDKYVRETIDFLLNREEAHNALFRDALNKVKNTGSNKDFGVTEDSKLYFDLSSPGPNNHDTKIDINPPSFETPIKK